MARPVRAVLLLLVALVATSPVSGQKAKPGTDLRGFDEWVTATMAEWHIPGLAVGAVRDGQVVFARGYGYRDVEAKSPVTSATVMGIGSNSKSFTAVLMAMLVDEKKLDWDTPVRSYLPDFQMYDDYATRHLTPRDLVTHRSGLPRHDNLWYGRPFSRKELYDRLRYLEPNTSFRNRYQYQNLMFMTAGYLVEKIAGRTWEEQIDDRIFTPLGMNRSNTTVRETPAAGDFAWPYAWRNDAWVRLPFRNIDAIAPAGSINSSVDDMLKYVQFRIDQGQVGGRRLVSEASERQMQSLQMAQTGTPDYPELGHGAYGLGVGVSTYRGRKLVSHGGGIDGYISAMSWMPGERLGVIVLTNLSGNNPVPTIVTRTLYDRLLAAPAVDWVARQKKSEAEGAERAAANRKEREAERVTGTRPSHPLEAYAGRYTHPGYGTLVVSAGSGNDLRATLDPHQVELGHFHYDVWEIKDPGNVVPFGGRVRFTSNLKGEVDRVMVPLEPAGAAIVFVRQ